jgi:hypothetical protein
MDNISSGNLNFTIERSDSNTLAVKYGNKEARIEQSALENETALALDQALRDLGLDPNESYSTLAAALEDFFEEEKKKQLKLVPNGRVLVCEANGTKVSVSWLPKKPHKVVEEIEKGFRKSGVKLTKEQYRQLNERVSELVANYTAAQESANEKKTQKFKEAGKYRNIFFESIYLNGVAKFLVYDAEKDNFSITDKIETETEIFLPTPKDQVPYEPYEYVEDDITTKEELYHEIYGVIEDYLVIPDEWKHLLTAFVLLSYEQAKISTVPYFAFVGDNESGKSTALEVLKRLSYRPLWGTTIPAADIYGYLADEDVFGVILEDEAQGLDRDIDKVKIFKSGYKKGAKVPRTLLTDYERKIVYFNTFSLKAIAAESAPTNKGLRERFLTCEMVHATPRKTFTHITPEEEKRFKDLRNKLLKYKLKNSLVSLPDFSVEFLSGRLEELLLPLLRVTYNLPAYDAILAFCKELVAKKEREGKETLEGALVYIVASVMVEEKSEKIPFETIWIRLQNELEGTVEDRKPNSFESPEFGTITKQFLGRRIADIFGAQKVLIGSASERKKGYVFNPRVVVALCSKYKFKDLKEGLVKSFNLEVESQKLFGKCTDVPNEPILDELNKENSINSQQAQIKNEEKSQEISQNLKTQQEENSEISSTRSQNIGTIGTSVHHLDNKTVENENSLESKSLPRGLCAMHYKQLPSDKLSEYKYLDKKGFCTECNHEVLGIYVREGSADEQNEPSEPNEPKGSEQENETSEEGYIVKLCKECRLIYSDNILDVSKEQFYDFCANCGKYALVREVKLKGVL